MSRWIWKSRSHDFNFAVCWSEAWHGTVLLSEGGTPVGLGVSLTPSGSATIFPPKIVDVVLFTTSTLLSEVINSTLIFKSFLKYGCHFFTPFLPPPLYGVRLNQSKGVVHPSEMVSHPKSTFSSHGCSLLSFLHVVGERSVVHPPEVPSIDSDRGGSTSIPLAAPAQMRWGFSML